LEQILVGNQIKIMFLVLSHDVGDHKGALPSVINYLQRLKRSPKISMISPPNKVRFTGNGNIKVVANESNLNTMPLTISFIQST
jgi:mRNA degradation ribonuclease J1/J2